MPIIVGQPAAPGVDITSSDGHVTVRLHSAWASVLLWTDLTGPLTVSRNGVVVATVPDLQGYWYDHFPPMGVPSSYTVSNGTTTSTAATITVPSDPTHRTWLKSAVNPNWSMALKTRPIGEVGRDNNIGIFGIDGDPGHPYVVFDDLGPRQFDATVKVTTAQRLNLEAMVAAGPVYWQQCIHTEEAPMWAAVSKLPRRPVQSGQKLLWTDVSLSLTEMATPKLPSTVTIPGWGWSDVMALYASWSTEMAANTSWLALIQRGVS